MGHSEHPLRSRPRRRPQMAYFAAALGAASLGLVTMAEMGGTAGATGTARVDAQSRTSAKVEVSEAAVAKFGKILIDQKGRALYYDTANKPNHFACTGNCLTAWPPLLLAKGQTAAEAGKGVTGLGTVRGPSGLQVTWKGKPLYTFIKDTKGTVTGQGVGHVWFVAELSAAVTKAPAPTTTAPPTTTPPTTTAPTTTAPTTTAPVTVPTTSSPPTTISPTPVAYNTRHTSPIWS